MKTLTAEVTLKVHYLPMFINRGYFNNIISQVTCRDTARVTLIVTIPETYIDSVTQYATSVSIIINKKTYKEELKQLRIDFDAIKASIHKLEDQAQYL